MSGWGMAVASNSIMAQSGPPDRGNQEPREPGIAALIVAPVAITLAAILMVLTVVLITFAQVFPAIITFGLALIVGLYGLAAALGKREAEPAGEEGGSSGSAVLPEARREALLDQAAWFASIFLAVLFFSSGLVQLLDLKFVVSEYAHWHYPSVLRWSVGLLQLVASVALVIPRIATIGASVLIPVMMGAIYTLLYRGPVLLAIVPLVVMLLLVFIGWERSATRRHMVASHHYASRTRFGS